MRGMIVSLLILQQRRLTLRSGEGMGSSRCRGGEHAPKGLAARASTGYAGQPAAGSREELVRSFRCHNCQTSSLMAFALFFCAAPFLSTGLPLKSPCCTRHIAVWLRVGSSRLKPHSSNCAACGLSFLAAFNACRYASASGRCA